MRIRTLGNQLTFYDEEGNIIIQIPNDPPEFNDENCREINIVDYEDRLMGIDPDAKPDFFLDIDEIDDFIEKHKKVVDSGYIKYSTVDYVIFLMLFIALCVGGCALGYVAGGDLLEYFMNQS